MKANTFPQSKLIFLSQFSLSLVLIIVSLAVYATPVRWDIVEMKFDDGGTGAGSFIYDEDTGDVSAVSISTTAGSTLTPGYTYTSVRIHWVLIPGPKANVSFTTLSGIPAAPLESILSLDFNPQLTNAGGVVDLLATSIEGICDEPIFCFSSSADATRYIISGSMKSSIIPIPPAIWLFGFGLLGLVGIARRKKTN